MTGAIGPTPGGPSNYFALEYFKQLVPNAEATLPGSVCDACDPKVLTPANTWTPQNLAAHMPAIQACVVQHATTLGLNDTFMFVMIACGVCAVLALFVGRDPAVQAAKEAKARGEEVAPREPAIVGE